MALVTINGRRYVPADEKTSDAGLSEAEVKALLRHEIVATGSLRTTAKKLGISPALLSGALNSRHGLGKKILACLGLEAVKTVMYRPIKGSV